MAEGSSLTAPTLLYIVGPPAVGKATVGHEIATRTGLRLFHNHMAIEPVLRFFDFGSPAFVRLVDGFRQSLIEEVAASDLPGLIFTYVWAFVRVCRGVSVEHRHLSVSDAGGVTWWLALTDCAHLALT
ncbi:hypothetical protein [Streptomyces sp. NBC_00063]|uniref:hypothetical protein n=1 Tax=Streptomyces sp. NBC_00063 TaxID=2975638 RepID=UPI00225B6329|nr:hypothetical protein [Streptomyces sp. NBC_00063]MCX5443815.1 AAA family ATPase [Streptomyces sp. NBC_00063]